MSTIQPRGIALILVLGTLALVTGSLALLTLAAAQSHRADSISRDERLSSDLLGAAEPIVQEWLQKKSPSAVVHPDSLQPVVPILDLSWNDDDINRVEMRSLRIAAWDLMGMVPSETSTASPLWLTVNADWRELPYAGTSTLLDLAGLASAVHPRVGSESSSLGSQVSVVPRLESSQSPRAPTININTAPKPLLEASLRLAQRGDLATILTARSDGRPAPAPRISTPTDRESALVRLAGRSTLWAVRVDATVNGLTRSWWTVYESRRGQWEIIERHAIPE